MAMVKGNNGIIITTLYRVLDTVDKLKALNKLVDKLNSKHSINNEVSII